jgi:hypothetical protein
VLEAAKQPTTIEIDGKQRRISNLQATKLQLANKAAKGDPKSTAAFLDEAFEAGIIADYDAQSAVECELVLRLASILWRLRRATTIETDCSRFKLNIA